ncbi:hypothetical protein KC332_g7249 [Hortaea werneckii]|nr:hypothetical protein KC358_g11771 [Hortaea werneckii]KAI6822639.1 hypothetical protein KC350_g9351 [Hortaea werneckii]KAI6915532.1 hypothetical protein KC348_g11985 [Hortaea werneckii]KAI6928531.1 hypothetical protein KC341_g11457 [Hortaea werneckii]KAI6957662.1 hypothetical protein KC321_g14464 [Hortaea werneckii]
MPSSQRPEGVEQRPVSETSHGHLTSYTGQMTIKSASDSVPSLVEDCTSDDTISDRNTTKIPSNDSFPSSDTASEEASPTNAARPESGFARMLKLHDILSETSEGQEPLNRWLGDTSDPWSLQKAYCAESQAKHGAEIERVLAHVDRLFPSQRMA